MKNELGNLNRAVFSKAYCMISGLALFRVILFRMRVFLFLAVLMISFMVSGPVFAQAQEVPDNVRLERLNIIFEGNESASAWMRHCFKGGALAARQFLENSILSAEFFAQEMMNEYGQMTTDQALEVLSDKQTEMAGPLNDFYQKNGCNTKQARAAKNHFERFNNWAQDDFRAFLQNIENE